MSDSPDAEVQSFYPVVHVSGTFPTPNDLRGSPLAHLLEQNLRCESRSSVSTTTSNINTVYSSANDESDIRTTTPSPPPPPPPYPPQRSPPMKPPLSPTPRRDRTPSPPQPHTTQHQSLNSKSSSAPLPHKAHNGQPTYIRGHSQVVAPGIFQTSSITQRAPPPQETVHSNGLQKKRTPMPPPQPSRKDQLEEPEAPDAIIDLRYNVGAVNKNVANYRAKIDEMMDTIIDEEASIEVLNEELEYLRLKNGKSENSEGVGAPSEYKRLQGEVKQLQQQVAAASAAEQRLAVIASNMNAASESARRAAKCIPHHETLHQLKAAKANQQQASQNCVADYHEALCTHYNTLLQSVQPDQEELDTLTDMYYLSMKHEVLDKCLAVLNPMVTQELHLQPGISGQQAVHRAIEQIREIQEEREHKLSMTLSNTTDEHMLEVDSAKMYDTLQDGVADSVKSMYGLDDSDKAQMLAKLHLAIDMLKEPTSEGEDGKANRQDGKQPLNGLQHGSELKFKPTEKVVEDISGYLKKNTDRMKVDYKAPSKQDLDDIIECCRNLGYVIDDDGTDSSCTDDEEDGNGAQNTEEDWLQVMFEPLDTHLEHKEVEPDNQFSSVRSSYEHHNTHLCKWWEGAQSHSSTSSFSQYCPPSLLSLVGTAVTCNDGELNDSHQHPSTDVNTNGVSDADYDDALSLLRNGATLRKHGRHGAPHARLINLDDSNKVIFVRNNEGASVKKKNVYPLKNVKNVLTGEQNPAKFKAGKCDPLKCFTIVFDDGRTLNLETEDTPTKDRWVLATHRVAVRNAASK